MADSVSFTDLGVPVGLSQVLMKQGISEPFEVQRESIPDSLLGKDVCCRAPTGSGKTLAFGLPMITNCKQAEVRNSPTALILTPTRELAEQITSVLTPLAHEQDLEIMSIYGGTSYGKQRKALDRGVDIVVACPGRLIDLMESNDVDLSGVNIVVLDEADRMADMGFIDPVCYLLDNCASDRQTILFSATLDDEVADLVRDYQKEPVTIEVGPKEVSMESMDHHFWLLKSSMKPDLTSEVIRRCGRTIVFCRTRGGVDRVGDDLGYDGLSIATLHGGLSQRQRDRAMEKFAEGWCDVLVATDVAARGIDVKGVECVIHYDPPENGKAYKHRSGRTARAGESGIVICFVQRAQKSSYIKIQKEVGIRFDFNPPDFSTLPEIDPEALKNAKRPRRRPTHDSGRNDRGSGGGGHGGGRGGQGRGGGRSGGRSGGRDGGRSGGRDGGRSGGRDGGRSGGRDGGRSRGRDGGRSGGRDGGDGERGDSRSNYGSGRKGGSGGKPFGSADSGRGGGGRSGEGRGGPRGGRKGGRNGSGGKYGGGDQRGGKGGKYGGKNRKGKGPQ